MKQSYKEKYEDILARLERAKNDDEVCDERFCFVIDDLIPELAESEDEKIKHEIKVVLANTDFSESALEYTFADMIAWLEKQGEKKPEENNGNLGGISANWSEEDSFRTETLISVIKSGGSIRPELRNEYINWLKSLRPQNTYNPYKAVVESIAEMCKHYDKASHSGLRDFYDNVKVKSKEAQEYDKMFPQAQWKPTDEQMGCLSDAIEHYNSLGYPASKLKELLDDLKKLKECV